MQKVDRVERLTDLLLALLDSRRPLTLREIAETVPGYPEGHEARRQAFERDKRTLREEGISITVEPAADGTAGYFVRPEDYYLPDLDLAPDEQVALNLAVAGVHLDDRSGRGALLKLGLADVGPAPVVASLPSLPLLAPLHGALVTRSTVAFGYRGTTRHVDPHLLRFRGGFWYIVGLDRERGELRTFRVDRIEGALEVGEPRAFEPPAAVGDGQSLSEPWRFGEGDPVAAEVLVDAAMASKVVAQLGEEAIVERRYDGSVVIRLDVTSEAGFRSWVLGELDHAVVLAPAGLRHEVISWLESIAGER